MLNLFQQLDKEQIPYVIWKDIDKVNDFFQGNSELDILINEKYQRGFEKIVYENGFVNLEVLDFLRKEGIEHYIKYEDGKYYHFHVYYRLITGNHYVKEYCFNIDNRIFESRVKRNGINVVAKEYEFALLILRLNIKQSFLFSSIKQSEINRVKKLKNEIDSANIETKLRQFAPEIDFKIEDLINIAEGVRVSAFKKLKTIEQFSKYRNRSVLSFYVSYLITKFYFLLLRAKRGSNKTISDKGVSIAILGTDGSGKTTITNKISKLFSAKTSCKTIYLGGNNKTYSILTRSFYYFYKIMRIFSPLKEKYFFAWFLYYLSVSLLEYGKALDRKKRINKGGKLVEKGWIIIYERFPIIGLFDFPNDLMLLRNNKWNRYFVTNIIDSILVKITNIIASSNRPDIIFLIRTDFEIMQQRRNLFKNEIIDIKRKLELQNKFLTQIDHEFCVISNNGKIGNVVDEMSNKVNQKICMYN